MEYFQFQGSYTGYYYDMASTDVHNSDKNNAVITPYYLLSTIIKNKEFYTRADIEWADRSRIYQVILGWIEISAFKTYVNNNFLLNCNITVNDIHRADHIYG